MYIYTYTHAGSILIAWVNYVRTHPHSVFRYFRASVLKKSTVRFASVCFITYPTIKARIELE